MKNRTQFKLWLVHWIMSTFSWSKWADITTFSFASSAYLLQGKVNRRSNAKKFRITSVNGNPFRAADPGSVSMERLKDCKLIDDEVKWPITQ